MMKEGTIAVLDALKVVQDAEANVEPCYNPSMGKPVPTQSLELEHFVMVAMPNLLQTRH